jgi:thioredoxin-like negative regulator of GroEL
MTLPPVYRSACEVLERWGHEDEAEALARAYVEQAARLAAAEKLAEAVERIADECDDPHVGRALAAALAEYRATKGDKG